MKTKLPQSISTVDEAKAFLLQLVLNNESYHPEDDANDVVWSGDKSQWPSSDECNQLNKLMSDIYLLPENAGKPASQIGFDPCEFLTEYELAQSYIGADEQPLGDELYEDSLVEDHDITYHTNYDSHQVPSHVVDRISKDILHSSEPKTHGTIRWTVANAHLCVQWATNS